MNYNKEVFIWTEAFNCAELLDPMLNSYLAHHDFKIHVYATENDFKSVKTNSPIIVKEILSNAGIKGKIVEKILLYKFKKGHSGTAHLWSYLITTRKEKIFIHLDADNIFVNETLNEMIDSIVLEGYSLVGSRRPYRFRAYRKNGSDTKKLNSRPDVVNTDCFAFVTDRIRKFPKFWLRRKIRGRRISLKPVVDFFDPVAFEIFDKGGKIKYMDSPNNGFFSTTNAMSAFLQNRISFAAVGSGINLYKNSKVRTSEGYARFSLASYSLYSREILNTDLGIESLEDQELISKIKRLDRSTWRLREFE